MGALHSSLYTDFTWSRNHVAASGANHVYLLVEWRGTAARPRKKRTFFNRVAEQVQLHLQLGAGVRINALYGYKAEMLNDRNITLNLGCLLEGMAKQIVLEFEFAPRSSGIHTVVTALWTYMDEMYRQVILPSRTISLQFSNHTAIFHKTIDLRVEKYTKLLQNPSIVENALKAYERGYLVEGEEIIRRRADEMLLYALRLGDVDYLREAEILYNLGYAFVDSYAASGVGV
ncbi:hypothetical protein MNQ98_06800 [Paenibacillus sp. N3/727]|uniref:hypothetical protein n=1 Tax=Paenibacillus sp. N3/727 TaxID=2925845 RepID=UPI001F539E9A|nr:hypothetical protein [Paenibacillus sp. N3/727]UNK19733.1 hypothetical protein MNQ98_06800 [Paenibacillus sp. N3/727]